MVRNDLIWEGWIKMDGLVEVVELQSGTIEHRTEKEILSSCL